MKSTVLHSDDYLTRKKRAGEVDSLLDLARTRQSELALEHAKLFRISKTKPELAEYDRYRAGLDLLGIVPDLAPEASQQRAAVSANLHQAEERCSELRQEVEAAENELATIPPDPPLLAFSARIASLRESTATYRKQRDDRPGLAKRAEAALTSAENLWNSVFPGQDISTLEVIARRGEEQATIRQLLDRLHRIEVEQETHNRAARDGADELERRRVELHALPPSLDTRVIEGIIATAPNASELIRHIQKISREIDVLSDSIALQSQKLLGVECGEAQLLAMDVPSPATISRYESAFDDVATALRDWRERKRAIDEARNDLTYRIEQEQLAGNVPTQGDLLAEREIRDRGWRLIRESAIDGKLSLAAAERQYEPGTPIADSFEGHLFAADHIADEMRAKSDRVVRIAELDLQLRKSRADAAQVAAETERHQHEKAQLSAEWCQLWAATGVTARDPREMREWSLQRDVVVQRVNELRDKRESATTSTSNNAMRKASFRPH